MKISAPQTQIWKEFLKTIDNLGLYFISRSFIICHVPLYNKIIFQGHRPVPVLIPQEVKAPLLYLASPSTREAANVEGNQYLFPNKGIFTAIMYDPDTGPFYPSLL